MISFLSLVENADEVFARADHLAAVVVDADDLDRGGGHDGRVFAAFDEATRVAIEL